MFGSLISRLTNPNNLTRIHLAKQIAQKGWTIGEFSYGTLWVRDWGDGTGLTVGPYCSFADEVQVFLGGNHHSEWVSTYPFSGMRGLFPEAPAGVKCHVSRGGVHIGADVWVGAGATILSGVRIGHGAIIGTRAVVTRDVPDYAIVGGNPAKVIRLRFEPDLIAGLVETAWWELPREQVASLIPLLQAGDIPALIAARKAMGSPKRK